MVLKTYQFNTEIKNLEGSRQSFREFLLFNKMKALRKGLIIPDDLISELEEYSQRNFLPELANEKIRCCPNCLKAHAVKSSKEAGLEPKAISLLSAAIDGTSIGHNGYYLDQDKVVKI